MIGQGVSSRSSHSDAAGRTTPSAKPWTHSRMSFWSCESSSEKGAVSPSGMAAAASGWVLASMFGGSWCERTITFSSVRVEHSYRSHTVGCDIGRRKRGKGPTHIFRGSPGLAAHLDRGTSFQARAATSRASLLSADAGGVVDHLEPLVQPRDAEDPL